MFISTCGIFCMFFWYLLINPFVPTSTDTGHRIGQNITCGRRAEVPKFVDPGKVMSPWYVEAMLDIDWWCQKLSTLKACFVCVSFAAVKKNCKVAKQIMTYNRWIFNASSVRPVRYGTLEALARASSCKMQSGDLLSSYFSGSWVVSNSQHPIYVYRYI